MSGHTRGRVSGDACRQLGGGHAGPADASGRKRSNDAALPGSWRNRPPSLHGVDLVDIGRTRCRATTDSSDEPAGGVRELTLAELHPEPVVIVVGAPGLGKTAELYRWHQDTPGSSWLNLAQMADANALARGLTPHEDGDTVFVDGCDKFDGNAAAMLFELGKVARAGTRLRISARESWWHHHRHLSDSLGQLRLVSLEPLNENATATLLAATGHYLAITANAEWWGAGDLVANPRLLVRLARLVEPERPPANRLELYQRLTQLDASESNKVVANIGERRDPVAVVALAQRAAALSTLTHRSTLVTDATAAGTDRINIAALHDIVDAPVSTAAWLVSSPLMVPSGDGWLFADRTTAEFFAAAELARCVTGERASERWRQLLSTVVGTERFVPPALRGVAAWAAEHDPAAFDTVFAIDPTVLVEQPGARYSRTGHARLFDAVLGEDVLLRQVSDQPGLIAACIDAVDDGGHQLVHLATSPDEPVELRRRALELISSSGLRRFDSVVATLVRDTEAPWLVRLWAMLTASERDDGDLLRSLYDVVTADDAPADPELRIFGMALSAMWPEHLSEQRKRSEATDEHERGPQTSESSES